VLPEREGSAEEECTLFVELGQRRVSGGAVAIGPVVVARCEDGGRAERVEVVEGCVYTASVHSLEPLFRSPSCAVKARFCEFMSAIRLGTLTVACRVEYGRSPYRPIA